MNTLRLIRLSDLSHAEYADASIVRTDSETVFLAGVCPLDAQGAVVALGDIAEQTRRALHNMDVILERCRVALDDVAFLRILVATDRSEDLGLAWNVVREHFGSHEVPATLQGVSVLGYPGQLVELEPIATRSPR
ncbi:RidA family protein [Leifsonia sp. Leaf264]|uniref:RidA family protein n=1 Tax=Leifsonia sp. Leaf264 TaxID=1736314 RepID=UPI0009E923AB|nr:RidA family protein [Leifsonia sp. Leaf264]